MSILKISNVKHIDVDSASFQRNLDNAEMGRWYNCKRVFVLKVGDSKYYKTCLNIFQRIVWTILGDSYLQAKKFEQKKVVVVDPKNAHNIRPQSPIPVPPVTEVEETTANPEENRDEETVENNDTFAPSVPSENTDPTPEEPIDEFKRVRGDTYEVKEIFKRLVNTNGDSQETHIRALFEEMTGEEFDNYLRIAVFSSFEPHQLVKYLTSPPRIKKYIDFKADGFRWSNEFASPSIDILKNIKNLPVDTAMVVYQEIFTVTQEMYTNKYNGQEFTDQAWLTLVQYLLIYCFENHSSEREADLNQLFDEGTGVHWTYTPAVHPLKMAIFSDNFASLTADQQVVENAKSWIRNKFANMPLRLEECDTVDEAVEEFKSRRNNIELVKELFKSLSRSSEWNNEKFKEHFTAVANEMTEDEIAEYCKEGCFHLENCFPGTGHMEFILSALDENKRVRFIKENLKYHHSDARIFYNLIVAFHQMDANVQKRFFTEIFNNTVNHMIQGIYGGRERALKKYLLEITSWNDGREGKVVPAFRAFIQNYLKIALQRPVDEAEGYFKISIGTNPSGLTADFKNSLTPTEKQTLDAVRARGSI